MAVKRISELPLAQDPQGLVTIGTNARNESVKVPIGDTMITTKQLETTSKQHTKKLSELEMTAQIVEPAAMTALAGASARFDNIDNSPIVNEEISSSVVPGGTIVFSTARKKFYYKVGGKYYTSWLVDNVPSKDLYSGDLKGRTYICGTDVYVWDSEKSTLVKVTTDLTEVNQSLAQHAGRLEELDAAVFPYSLSVSGGGVYEKGTSQSVTITWSMKKGSSPIVPDSVKINEALVTGTNKVYAGVTTNTTYNVAATKSGVTKTASTSVRFVNPSYLGVVSESFTPSESAIKILAKGISESKGRTLSGANLTNQKVCYAYPKSFGALTSIKDANNFEYINSYIRSELTINGEAYYVYILKDATSVSGFKQVYS